MEVKTEQIIIKNKKCSAILQYFNDKTDKKDLQELFQLWLQLKNKLKEKSFRGPNMPEGISEMAFAIEMDCPRCTSVNGSSSSFDCYDPVSKRRLQIKATSSENELTSFGPKSIWDSLYFMDFYNNKSKTTDGSYKIYEIPNDLIYNHQVSRTETFTEQQASGRRPRFSIRTIIKNNNIPITRSGKI